MKKGVKLFSAAAMAAILMVGGGSRAFAQADPRLNAHATDSGTDGSVQWKASLVAAGNTVTGRTSASQSVRVRAKITVYGTNNNGDASYEENSDSGQSAALTTVVFEGSVSGANSTHEVLDRQVAALSI